MAEYKGFSGNIYRTENEPFAGGGEGNIYDIIGAPQYVAKIYKSDNRTKELERKLSVMVSNQPSVLEQYAWPLDVLYENGTFVGYVMPKIEGKEKLRNIYVYDNRQGKPWSLYIAIAKNLSAAVYNVHEMNQVIGDLNPENILVNPKTGMVTLVDTDSYHISDTTRTYRCRVGMPEYVAPELQGIHYPSAPLPTFTPASDRFSLAVLIFALLMNGAHPFACTVISGSLSKFQPIDNIANGKCAFFQDSRTSNMEIPRYAPDISSLPENIQMLFKRAFIAGYTSPSQRPTAEEWYQALEQLEVNLKTCLKDPRHIFYYGASECPWCKVREKMHSISQTVFNSSSHTGSVVGTGSIPTSTGGQSQQFTPYQYTPSNSTTGAKKKTKSSASGWIILVLVVIIFFIAIKSCSGSRNSKATTSTITSQSTVYNETTQRNETNDSQSLNSDDATINTLSLIDARTLYEEGGISTTSSSVEDNLGISYDGGAHIYNSSSKEGSAVYLNEGYTRLVGRVIVRYSSRNCSDCGWIKIYGDDELLFDSGRMGKGVFPVDFDLDISSYSQITITSREGDYLDDYYDYPSCYLVDTYFLSGDELEINSFIEGLNSSRQLNYSKEKTMSILDIDAFYEESEVVVSTASKTDNYGTKYDGSMFVHGSEDEGSAVYLVDGYARLYGRVIVEQCSDGDASDYGWVKIYGDENLIFDSGDMTSDSMPIDFDIDISTYSQIRITTKRGSRKSESSYYHRCYLVDTFFAP